MVVTLVGIGEVTYGRLSASDYVGSVGVRDNLIA